MKAWCWVAATLVFLPFSSGLGVAETFLGEEEPAPAESAAGNTDKTPAESSAAELREPEADVPELPDNAAEGGGSGGATKAHEPKAPSQPIAHPFTFSGGFGAGSGFINAQATLGYLLSKYIGIETSYYYYRFSTDNATGVQQGPEVDLVGRFVNRYLVVPIMGFGPGYTNWSRTYEGSAFSSGNSATANAFYGLDLNLTNHFGIEITRKVETYLGSRPISFADRSTYDARWAWTTNIGFRVLF